MTYKIVRKYRDYPHKTITIATGLTLEQAQEHCQDPETSSSTCTKSHKRQITRKWGPWFDCYYEE